MALSKIRSDSIEDTAIHGRRNLVINGAMTLSQRGTSFDGAEQYLCDRWRFGRQTDGYNLGWSQSTAAPDGFANSLKLDVTTADTSLNADVFALMQQRFEGQNLQMLKKGTSAAESVTVSFYVRSAKTGTYNLEMLDKDNSRHLIKAYTINSADTWEYKTVTFEGDTTGAFDNDNARSLDLNWWLAAGSNFNSGTRPTSWQAQDQTDRAVGQVNIFDSTSNDWYITGVQMEVGQATPFEHEPFVVTLQKSQRYFQTLRGQDRYPAYAGHPNVVFGSANLLQTPMRTQPTLSVSGVMSFDEYYVAGRTQSSSHIGRNSGNTQSVIPSFADFSGLTRGNPGAIYNANINIDAEL